MMPFDKNRSDGFAPGGSAPKMKSQQDWQSQVDDACAQVFDAGQEYQHAKTDLEQARAGLAAARKTDFQTSIESAPPIGDSFPPPPIGQTQFNPLQQKCFEAQQRFDLAEGLLKEAIPHIESLLAEIQSEHLRAGAARLSTQSPHFSDHFEDAAAVRELEADFFRGLIEQLKEALRLVEKVAAGSNLIRRSRPRSPEENEINILSGPPGSSPWELIDLPHHGSVGRAGASDAGRPGLAGPRLLMDDLRAKSAGEG